MRSGSGRRSQRSAASPWRLPCSPCSGLRRPASRSDAKGLARAFRDRRFVGGLWLNTLPALLFGMLVVLTPLALDDAGWSPIQIATVFFAAGLIEVVINPILGRVTDRRGRLLPIRVALTGSLAVASLLAIATEPIVIAFLVGAAAITFGAMYTPGMALTSHRADSAGLPQGLAFGIMNSAWALGALIGPPWAACSRRRSGGRCPVPRRRGSLLRNARGDLAGRGRGDETA